MAPTILFVPGFWEGPAPFGHVSKLLRSHGYPTETVLLPSTGTKSPGNPSMKDDIAAIRVVVEKLVAAEQEIVMVLHSAGGFLGSHAIEGLINKARREKNEKGGVSSIVFLTAGIAPEGTLHGPLPFFEFDLPSGAIYCAMPQKLLFGDLDEAATEKWMQVLSSQPAAGWDDTITYCGWREVPSVYLICEGDAVLSEVFQTQLAELAGSKIVRCSAGHMPMISVPEKVVEVVIDAAQSK